MERAIEAIEEARNALGHAMQSLDVARERILRMDAENTRLRNMVDESERRANDLATGIVDAFRKGAN